jgi:hypothetical protein
MWWPFDAVVASAGPIGLVVAVASLWLTWFYGERTCALLKGLIHRDNPK